MSKANSKNIRKQTTQDKEIKERFIDYTKSLPQSRFQDRKGFSIRRTLTKTEQDRFNDSLPEELQKYREQLREAARDEQQIEDVEDEQDIWDEEELLPDLTPDDGSDYTEALMESNYNSFRNIENYFNNTIDGVLGLDPNQNPMPNTPDEIRNRHWVQVKEATWYKRSKPHKLSPQRISELMRLAEHNSRQEDNYLYGKLARETAPKYVNTGHKIIGGFNMLQPKGGSLWADQIHRGHYNS